MLEKKVLLNLNWPLSDGQKEIVILNLSQLSLMVIWLYDSNIAIL